MIFKSKYFYFLFFTLLYTGFLLWRVGHPIESRLSPNRYIHDETNHHDDLVTYLTAKNFNEEGFWKSYGVPNRRGAITQGYWGIPCSPKPGDKLQLPPSIKKNFEFVGPDGNSLTSLTSSYENCYYTHFPPFSDWIGAVFYKLGGSSYLAFKVLAIIIKGIGLFIWLCFFSRFFKTIAVLAGALVYATFFYQVTWASSLYMQPWSYLFLALLFFEATRFQYSRWWTAFYVCLLYLTTLELMLAPLCSLILLGKKDWLNYLKKVFFGGLIASLIIYLQRAFFFSSLWTPVEDMFVKAYARYSYEHFSGPGWRLLYQTHMEHNSWVLFILFILCLGLLFYVPKRIRLLFLSLALLVSSLWILNPSYAMIHINHWFALFLIFVWAMFVLVFHCGLSFKLKMKRGLLLVLGALFSLAFLRTNANYLFNDYLLFTKARVEYQAHNLVYKPLVLLYAQVPVHQSPYYNYNIRDALNDGVWGRFSFNESVRPTYVEFDQVQRFLINIHFLEEQFFKTITFSLNTIPANLKIKCVIRNLYQNVEALAQASLEKRNVVLSFPEQKGKDFQLLCRDLPKASLLELGIY